MAKNIYRKYRAVEKFEYRLIERDREYDFSSDTTYTTEQRKKLSDIRRYLLRFNLKGGPGYVSIDYSVDEYNKKIKSSKKKYILNDETYNLNAYFNLDSFYLHEYILRIRNDLTGYEDGNIFLKYKIGDTSSNASLFQSSHFLGTVEYREFSTGFIKGEYVGEVEAEEGTYPLEQNHNGFWYEYDRPTNYPPKISGSDYDMGSKTDNFDIEYYVSDQNDDSINVKILLDDIQKETKSVFNNQKNTYTVNIKNLNLGSHTVKIVATDSFGASDTRTYTFYKSNTAPKISGQDKDLGGKSLGFTITYDVTDSDGDEVDVTITLNNEELSNISTTSKNGLTFTLDDEKVKKLTIGDVYTITIKADDRKGGIAYRRFTFTKTNSVPVISGNDTDLGEKSEIFSHTFSVTDYEKDPIAFRVKLDGKVIKEVEEASDGEEYTAEISHEDFIRLSYGEHKITIEAWDSINADKIQKRELTFTRVASGLDVEIKLATSKVQPKKIIAVPHGLFASDATLQVLVCNNYLDESPVWEDASDMSRIARAYSFTNTEKTSDEWAIGIKIVVENGESEEASILRGVKGGFE